MSGQDLGKGSKIQAADGSTVEVAHPPEVSEKRGKVVLQTDKAKFLGLRAIFPKHNQRIVNVVKQNINRRWFEQI